MRKILSAMAVASALAMAAPAAAQYAYASGDAGISNRIGMLEARYQAGLRDGTISRREANQVGRQLRDLRMLERRYSYNGLTRSERDDLQMRIRTARQQLRYADGGRYDRDARFGQWNDGYYGQGGVYEPVDMCRDRGGIRGLIESVLGDDWVRVGERAPSNLYAVPYQYQGQFRDTYGVYYRSDGRAIYQIDARTNRVTNIIPMVR